MKRMTILWCTTFCIVCASVVLGNPILAPTFINEFGFDSTGWKMELHIQKYNDGFPESSVVLDSLQITSLTDTAYIKPGITVTDSTFVILTSDSLTDDLYINPEGDRITIDWLETFEFGASFSGYTLPFAPKMNQSIGVYKIAFDLPQYYYDTSPTFGASNDTAGAMGGFVGFVVDSSGTPLDQTKVLGYFLSTNVDTLTDNVGRFHLCTISGFSWVGLRKSEYEDLRRRIFIWPDSSVTDTFVLSKNISAPAPEQPLIQDYALEQNYPNPFNVSTSFAFTLPKQTHVEIAIYDINGKLVKRLYSGTHPAGRFTLLWSGESVASGVYFYQMTTPERTLWKKCVLLK